MGRFYNNVISFSEVPIGIIGICFDNILIDRKLRLGSIRQKINIKVCLPELAYTER
jgi:hypothetical protein